MVRRSIKLDPLGGSPEHHATGGAGGILEVLLK
jgi:hypothetical protein